MKIYIEKIKGNLKTRIKEHFINIKNREAENSAVAARMWKDEDSVDHEPILLKQALDKEELTN